MPNITTTTKINIGFLMNDVGANQLAFHTIFSANEFLKEHSQTLDVAAFYTDASPSLILPNFAITNMADAFKYEGSLVATNLRTAERLIRMPNAGRKLFFVQDLEWLRPTYRNSYEPVMEIYRNPKLEILVRSTSHADLFELCWSRKPTVINEAQIIPEIYNYIRRKNG